MTKTNNTQGKAPNALLVPEVQAKVVQKLLKAECLEQDQIATLLSDENKKYSLEVWLLCYSILNTGAHLTELLNLTYGDVDRNGLFIILTSNKSLITRPVPISQEFLKHLNEWEKAQNEKGIETSPESKLFGIRPGTARKKISQFLMQAKINNSGCTHKLRSTYIYNLLRLGLSNQVISMLLGRREPLSHSFLSESINSKYKVIGNLDEIFHELDLIKKDEE